MVGRLAAHDTKRVRQSRGFPALRHCRPPAAGAAPHAVQPIPRPALRLLRAANVDESVAVQR